MVSFTAVIILCFSPLPIMSEIFSSNDLQTLTRVIQQRRTFKVMGDVGAPVVIDSQIAEKNRAIVLDSVKSADSAPFHYDRHWERVPQPWRVNILWHQSCQKVAANFYDWFDDVKPGNKLPSMLSACGACVLVSWLPQFSNSVSETEDTSEIPKSKQIQIDQEHLAAASAYVQNLMLLLTAANMGTYWSSGGQFRTPSMMDRLSMAAPRQLLAAVFVEFPETNTSDVQRLPGKLADARANLEDWMDVVQI